MSADPLDTLNAFLSRPYGCVWVALFSLLLAGALWRIDRRVFGHKSPLSKIPRRDSSRRELIREYELMVLHGCLRLFSLAAALLAATYLSRAWFLREFGG